MLRVMATVTHFGYLPDGTGGRRRVVNDIRNLQLLVTFTGGTTKDGVRVKPTDSIKAVGYYYDLMMVSPLDEVMVDGKTYTVETVNRTGRNEITIECNAKG